MIANALSLPVFPAATGLLSLPQRPVGTVSAGLALQPKAPSTPDQLQLSLQVQRQTQLQAPDQLFLPRLQPHIPPAPTQVPAGQETGQPQAKPQAKSASICSL